MNRESIFIEVEELRSRLDDFNIRLYDATIIFFEIATDPTTAYEKYLQGHIPGAAFFDHDFFSDLDNQYEYMALPVAQLPERIGRVGISQDSEVILYASGVLPAATRGWWLLRFAGHNNVRVLNGGVEAWTKAGGPLEQEPHTYEPTTFASEPRPAMFANKEEVLAAMEDESICIEYTLPQEMYGGSYIPTSRFVPVWELMVQMDGFALDDTFITRLQEMSSHKKIITYCGGGIAATINAIAHLIAGHENVAVYDGSLIEWMGEGLPVLKK